MKRLLARTLAVIMMMATLLVTISGTVFASPIVPLPAGDRSPVAVQEHNEEPCDEQTLYTTCRLWLRTSPRYSDDNKIICMPKNAAVKTIAVTDNGWYKLRYGSHIGYSASKYLIDVHGGSTMYSTFGIFLRTSPKYSGSNKICLIPRGTKFTLLSVENGNWYRVRYNGKTGYVPSKYTAEEEQGVIIVNTTCALKLRTKADKDSPSILTIPKGANVRLIKKYNKTWYKVSYNGHTGYVNKKYLTDISYPLVYKDGSMTVTVNRTWYKHAYVYTAHIQTTNYKRFGTYSANNKWNSFCTPSTASKQINAIVLTNGDYSSNWGAAHASGGNDYGTAIARRGKVLYDKGWYGIGLYNYHNGKLFNSHGVSGYHGKSITSLVNAGEATDTFNFFWTRPVFEGQNQVSESQKNSSDRRPRTFIGTNGKAGDIWICVADGDYRDGKSVGLNSWERAQFLIDKCHCTFGVGLDGGGSSAFIYNGFRLTGGSNERSVCDFVFIR